MNAYKDEVWDRFTSDIPEDQREDILTRLSEAANGIKDKDIAILDIDRRDAINCTIHGILQFGENEHCFVLEDGNMNGTQLLEWDGEFNFKILEPRSWALQPLESILDEHFGREKFLLAKWEALEKNPEVSEIAGKYSYDKYFEPTLKTEEYWQKRANKYGFRLVPEHVAIETRKNLKSKIN